MRIIIRNILDDRILWVLDDECRVEFGEGNDMLCVMATEGKVEVRSPRLRPICIEPKDGNSILVSAITDNKP